MCAWLAAASEHAKALAGSVNQRAFEVTREQARGETAQAIREGLDADIANFFVDA